MQFYITTLFFLVCDQINKIFSQQIPISPCPGTFQYLFDGIEWFGIMSVSNPGLGEDLHIKITLSITGKPISTYYGEVQLLTRGQYEANVPVLYKVKFPKHTPPPNVMQILANNKIICMGNADSTPFFTQIQLEHTRKYKFFQIGNKLSTGFQNIPPPGFPQFFTPQSIGSNSEGLPGFLKANSPMLQYEKNRLKQLMDICGRTSGNTVRGCSDGLGSSSQTADEFQGPSMFEKSPATALYHGAWPWLAAVYVQEVNTLSTEWRYEAHELLIILGRHNLRNWSEDGSVTAPCIKIYIHPNYDAHLSTYDADIAILVLKIKVRFTTYVLPVCLWASNGFMNLVEGERGVVISWGLKNQSQMAGTSNPEAITPKANVLTIVSRKECVQSNSKFRVLVSERNFCAGNHKGTNICSGDSGAGIIIWHCDRWVLRGLVSAKISHLTRNSSCFGYDYIIFTDVEPFFDWVFAFLA